ncbi:MAG: hypothetical protein EXR65_05675 [Dehalococcoidia bacterium]|nr:hypothetical protein [Dehalococcoidia bacterium]
MPAAPAGPLDRQTEQEVMRYLAERLATPVGLDVWTRPESALVLTDRDPCTHCAQTLATMRQLVRLHQALSVTAYDLERHASRAAAAGVEMAPTTIVRSRGHAVHVVGLCAGVLFPALLDLIGFLSQGATPLTDASREALGALQAPLRLELQVAPYDGYSAHLMRLTGALAAESRLVRLRITEVGEFPLLAARRGVTEVPLLTIEGRRFAGAWEEPALIEQIGRIVAGNEAPVIRDHVYTMPFFTEEEAQRLAAEQATATGATPAAPHSGLYVPGRDGPR